jgi:hypothetical protein
MRSESKSLWRAYQEVSARSDGLQLLVIALGAARRFEETADFRGAGVWHREAYYSIYLHRQANSPFASLNQTA